MKSYLQLLKKELVSIRWHMGVLLVLTVGWHVFLAIKAPSWGPELAFGLGWIPLSFIPIWLLWMGFQTYRSEWSHDTAYLLMALPVPGWKITTSKLLAVMIAYVSGLALFVASFGILLGSSARQVLGEAFVMPAEWYVRTGLNGFVLSLLLVSTVIMLTHFSYIASRMVKRMRGFMMVWVLLIALWLTQRIGYVIEPLLAWIPWMAFDTVNYNNGITHLGEVRFSLAPVLAPWLVVVALFFVGTWLWETQIEIA